MATNYIRIEDAVRAVEFGITHASAINIETGEWTELFQRENDELREAVERIKDIEPADVIPVVRCRDCRKCIYDSLFDHWWCTMTPGTRRVKPDDFCSYGERKE